MLSNAQETGTHHFTADMPPFKTQLLKWIGNKQRFAHQIARYFPIRYRTYYEPFLGSGAVLGTFQPHSAVGSDALKSLVDIWKCLQRNPQMLKQWYRARWQRFHAAKDRVDGYEAIKASYNANPNAADFVFLSRSCYGGVIRFRKDGYMSTACGAHNPISPASFDHRVDLWAVRTAGATFAHQDYRDAMARAGRGDVVYCDPPFSDTQAILYGAQAFNLDDLIVGIERAKERGAKVALSIDGSKKSGAKVIDLRFPDGLFEREAVVNVGVSMLRRFQREGETLDNEVVSDRLLLTW